MGRVGSYMQTSRGHQTYRPDVQATDKSESSHKARCNEKQKKGLTLGPKIWYFKVISAVRIVMNTLSQEIKDMKQSGETGRSTGSCKYYTQSPIPIDEYRVSP